jgi:hypothetical protein
MLPLQIALFNQSNSSLFLDLRSFAHKKANLQHFILPNNVIFWRQPFPFFPSTFLCRPRPMGGGHRMLLLEGSDAIIQPAQRKV